MLKIRTYLRRLFMYFLIFILDNNNCHEIVTELRAMQLFFDILAPSFHTEIHEDFFATEEDEDLRECHFFSEISLPPNNNNILSDQNQLHKRPHSIVQ